MLTRYYIPASGEANQGSFELRVSFHRCRKSFRTHYLYGSAGEILSRHETIIVWRRP